MAVEPERAARLARRILNVHPPDRLRRPGKPPQVLVLGADPLARELCRGLLRLCHFRHGVAPGLTVAAAPGAIGDLEDFLPGGGLVGTLRAFEAAVDDTAALRASLKDAPPVSAIYDCAGWDAAALGGAFDGFPPPLTALAPAGEGHRFACLDAVDPAIEDDVDGSEPIARAIHELYLQEQLARGRSLGDWPTLLPWDELTDRDRDGNRFLADHIQVKLRDIGCGVMPAGAGGSLQFTPGELDRLARAEHERWSAVRLLSGYRYGPVRDDEKKHHPDLVPFDELSAAQQDLDRIAVRATDAYLARAGLGVRRDAPVAVLAADGVEAGRGFAEGVGRLIGELGRHYPDRRLVLRCRLAVPVARAFCEAAMAKDGLPLVAVQVDAPPPEEAWPLLQRAARIELAEDEAGAERLLHAGARLAVRVGGPAAATMGREVALDASGRIAASPWS